MASGRRIGTNETVNTYDSAGGKDYSDVGVWEAATDLDLVATTTSYGLSCYRGVHADNGDIADAIANATYFRRIFCAVGESYIDQGGIPLIDGSHVYFVTPGPAGVNQVFDLCEDNAQMQDIIAANLKSRDGAGIAAFKATNDNVAYVGCVGYKTVNAGTGEGWNFFTGGANNHFFINCMSIGSKSYGYKMAGGVNYTYNCTSYGEGTASIEILSDTTNSKNCIFSDGIVLTGGTHNQTTNTVATPTYRDAGNDDLHLAYNDAIAKDNGTDLSGDGTYPFDDDVDYKVRSADWDMGADQYSCHAKVNGVNWRTTRAKWNNIETEDIRTINGVG